MKLIIWVVSDFLKDKEIKDDWIQRWTKIDNLASKTWLAVFNSYRILKRLHWGIFFCGQCCNILYDLPPLGSTFFGQSFPKFLNFYLKVSWRCPCLSQWNMLRYFIRKSTIVESVLSTKIWDYNSSWFLTTSKTWCFLKNTWSSLRQSDAKHSYTVSRCGLTCWLSQQSSCDSLALALRVSLLYLRYLWAQPYHSPFVHNLGQCKIVMCLFDFLSFQQKGC